VLPGVRKAGPGSPIEEVLSPSTGEWNGRWCRSRTRTKFPSGDFRTERKGRRINLYLIRRPFPFPRSTRSALQSEGYGHPRGQLFDPARVHSAPSADQIGWKSCCTLGVWYRAPVAGNDRRSLKGTTVSPSSVRIQSACPASVTTSNDARITLAEMFRDYGDVWLSIEVAGETLSPRVRILARPSR